MSEPITLQTTVDELKMPLDRVLILSTNTQAADMGSKGLWQTDPNTPVLIQEGNQFILATSFGELTSAHLPRTWSALGASLRAATPPPQVPASTALVELGTRTQWMLAVKWLLVVDDETGGPLGLLPGSQVGEALKNLQVADWPANWQDDIALDAVIVVDEKSTLQEVAGQFKKELVSDNTQVVSYDSKNGRWIVYPVKSMIDAIQGTMPQPGPDYPAGRLFSRLNADSAGVTGLADATWTTVQNALPAESKARLILAQDGQPAWVLSRKHTDRTMRSGESKGGPRGVGSLAEFLDQYAASPGAADGGRVVNAWFADERQAPVAPTRALGANMLYHLGVNIGAPSPNVNVKGEQPEVPARVIAALVASGEEVIFRLDSEDFLLLEHTKSVPLSQTRTTPDLYFRLVTPVQTGRCRLRLGVYVRENLIQSYQVFAHVAPVEGEIPEKAVEGWWSVCEYTLSADLTNLDALEKRRVCIWVGDGRGQTQRAGLSGEGFDLGTLPPINVALIENAFAEYRQVLDNSCHDHTTAQYFYNPATHEPLDPKTFDEGMKNLAEIGQMLYQHLFGDHGETLGKTLWGLEQNQDGPLVLQIARLNLDMTFPWAVLYDRTYRFHPARNTVCAHFADSDACRTDCPHQGDPYVVCPYGFWGFRYIIEQPLRPPNAHSSIITALPGSDLQLHLTFGPDLGLTSMHSQIVQTIVGTRRAVVYGDQKANPGAQSTDTLIEAFGKGMTLAYFYCHGGNKGTRQWLQVGAGDPLFPAYLKDELRVAWQENNSAPLVVLNGCHTAKYTPETFLSFIHRFGALGAAGVIGTEVPIHEYLGKYFGEFFMERFLKGDPVGQIIYDFRLDLLKRKNFLGFLYVPYCYATLHLERGGKG